MPAKPTKADAKAPPPVEQEPEQEAYGVWDGDRNEEKLPHGQGKATYPNGDTYVGRIENNNREGHGKYTWKPPAEGQHGGVYEGEYESNKKHGNGVMKYPDEGVYDGEFSKLFLSVQAPPSCLSIAPSRTMERGYERRQRSL